MKGMIMRTTIAVIHKNGGNSAPAVVKALESFRLEEFCYVLATPSAIFEANNLDKLREKNMNSPVIVGGVFSKSLAKAEPRIVSIKDAAFMFEGRIYCSTRKTVSMSAVVQRTQADRENAVKSLIAKDEGDFSLAI